MSEKLEFGDIEKYWAKRFNWSQVVEAKRILRAASGLTLDQALARLAPNLWE